MKTITTAIALCLVVFGATAQQAPAATSAAQTGVYRLTLEQCLEWALRGNYRKQSLVLSEQAADETLHQSKLERLPGVSASASENFSHSQSAGSSLRGEAGLNAGMTLWQGGSIGTAIEQNRLLAEQAGYNTAQYDNTLTIDILQAYLTILGNEELLRYQRSIADASRAGMEQGSAQYKAGTVLESDFLLLEAQYASDLNNIADTEIALQNGLLKIKGLLSIGPNAKLEVIRPDTARYGALVAMPGLNEVLDRSAQSVPELKISQYNVDIAGAGVRMARSGYFPTLSLSGGVGTSHRNGSPSVGTQFSDNFSQSAGLSLSVPLFNNGRTRSNVARSRISLQQAELDQKQTVIDVVETVTVQYNDVVSSLGKYRTTDRRQRAYESSFEAYRAQFNAGSITAVELLQQQNNYISALNDYIQSKYGFMLKRKVLDVWMGIPITL